MEIKAQLTADIKVEQKITFPDAPNITESYLCLVKFAEFKKLIVDEQGGKGLNPCMKQNVLADWLCGSASVKLFIDPNILGIILQKPLHSS